MQLSEEMVAEKKIYLFSHTNVVGCREDPFGVNLGGLCYESISSHFCFGNLLYVTLKTAEILSQVRLNQTFMKKLLFVKE